MDIEPEIILEDGEIFSDEDICTPNERPPGFSKSVPNRTRRINLEDGEVHDDVVVYTPLERPPNLTNTYKVREKSSDNDSELSSISSSDSDDFTAKKPKVKFKSKKFNIPPMKRKKKYDIWSSHIQEDVLAETLVSCEVSNMLDRSLGIESYPHTELRHKLNAMRQQGNKRRHDQRNNSKMSSQRRCDTDEEDLKGSERIILDLITTVDNTNEEVAKDIANKLCEEKDDLIGRIVQIAGKRKSIEIFNETKLIELGGGMLIMNGTRRRTPGGVFLFLLKRDDDITNEQQKLIFTEERQEQKRERKGQQKAKLKKIKGSIVPKKSDIENSLPLLLSRSDLIIQKSVTLRDRNESEPEDFVNNPPPSPVTDGKENSNDGVELPSYFLESGNVVDMDIF